MPFSFLFFFLVIGRAWVGRNRGGAHWLKSKRRLSPTFRKSGARLPSIDVQDRFDPLQWAGIVSSFSIYFPTRAIETCECVGEPMDSIRGPKVLGFADAHVF